MKHWGRIFLIGPMGAGKTTIGKMLADELRLDFKDADSEIESRSGVDIPWIFDMEGEEGFRTREASMLSELSELDSTVISTGGGAVNLKENRNLMAGRGLVIYLHTPVAEQLRRTGRDRNRPMLQGDDAQREEILRSLMEHREPLYREIADVEANTAGRSPRSVVQELTKKLREDS